MVIMFYIAALIAVLSTVLVITRHNAVHALLNLVISLLSVAVIFFLLGAPFIAALEVIVYAGAIIVLFVFVVMMLNLGKASTAQEAEWLKPTIWIGPAIFAIILGAQLIYILFTGITRPVILNTISPKEVGMNLFGPYMIGVELAALLLLAGMVGAYHLGRRKKAVIHRFLEETKS